MILVYAFLLLSSISSAINGNVWGVVWATLLTVAGASFLAHVAYEMRKEKKQPQVVDHLWNTEKDRIDQLVERKIHTYLTQERGIKGDKDSHTVWERGRVIQELLNYEVLNPVHASGRIVLIGYKNDYSYENNLVGYRVSRHIAGDDKSPTPRTFGADIYFTLDFKGPMSYGSLIQDYESSKKKNLIGSGWAKSR